MKTESVALACLLALGACAEPPPPKAATPPGTTAPTPRCLSIVAWNDLHGQLDADLPVVDTGPIPAGGVIAIAGQLQAIRATGDDVVVLDAGDLFTGPMETSLAEGAPIIDAYRVLGVDAVAIGNHDFDFGPVGFKKVTAPEGVGDEAGAAGPRGALLARMASAPFPFLSANIHKKGGAPTGWPNFRPSTQIERGAFRVGVVGYTTQDTPATTMRPNVRDLDFATGAAASVAEQIRALRAASAAPVILLAHAGIEGAVPHRLDDSEPHTGELVSLVEGLGQDKPDLIIAGHRHIWMTGRIHGIPVVASDQHGVGLARIRYCGSPLAPTLTSLEHRVVFANDAPPSELAMKVLAAVAPFREQVKAQAEAPVATLPRPCAAQAKEGTALADLIARATKERVRDALPPPADVPVVGFVNAGGVRAPLPAGVVRFADVFKTMPFENMVAACATTRAGLVRFLSNAFHGDSTRGRFPLGIAGARVHTRRDAAGGLSFVSVEIDGGKAPKDDAPVWLALSDFVLFGGDRLMDGVVCTQTAVSETRVRDAFQEVLAREPACDGPAKSVVVE